MVYQYAFSIMKSFLEFSIKQMQLIEDLAAMAVEVKIFKPARVVGVKIIKPGKNSSSWLVDWFEAKCQMATTAPEGNFVGKNLFPSVASKLQFGFWSIFVLLGWLQVMGYPNNMLLLCKVWFWILCDEHELGIFFLSLYKIVNEWFLSHKFLGPT